MTTPVSFEIAKLLKEKGFDEPCRLCVEDGDERPLPFDCGNTIHRNSLHPYYSAPSISEVVMWLYEKHEIWIKVDWYNKNNNGIFWSYTLEKIVNYPEPIDYTPQNTIVWNSPTEAYEAAILYTLNNLI